MPTYEYACTACGHRLEAVQKFTDDALTECPECGAKLRKVYGAPGIVLKGSGFYKTDSRAQDKRASAEKSNGANGSDSSGSDTKTEKTESTTKSSDSGSKTEPSKSSGGDKPVKESKTAASAAT